MQCKKIAALPIPECNKNGHALAAQIFNNTLVIDCWKEGIYKGRYCLDKNGQYKAIVSGEWHQYTFRSVFGYSWWSWSEPSDLRFIGKDTRNIILNFIEPLSDSYMRDSKISRQLEHIESKFRIDKRDRALQRKVDRIDTLMQTIPPCPDNFEEWAFNTIFGSREYMFFDKNKKIYTCTACGKTHSNKTAKHNDFVLCCRTGKRAQIKRRQQYIRENEAAMILQPVDETKGVARHFSVWCIWSGNKKGITAYESIRIILNKNDLNSKFKIYYGQRNYADEFSQDWWDTNPANKRAKSCYCYPYGIFEAVKNTAYEVCGIQHFANLGLKVNYNNIMWAHGQVGGIFEYLAKCGMYQLLADESESIYWGSYYGNLNYKGSTDSEVLCIDKQRVNRLRQNNGGNFYLKWMWYEEVEGIRIPEETLQWYLKNKLLPSDIQFVDKKISPIKIANYIQKQKELCNETVKQTITTWKDYISMAERLKMNTDAEQIFKPKDLYAAHQEAVKRINSKADQQEARTFARKYPLANKVLKTLGIYEWGNDEYRIVAPKSIIDIIREGRALSHCVGTSDRYFDRIATRESYILFLRRADRVDKPFYTLEVEPGGTIRQKRTTGDKQTEDIKQATAFLKEWQKVVIARIGEQEKQLAEKSKTLRVENFKELRKNGNTIHTGTFAGKLLVDVLEKDLMEIEAS